MKKSAIRASHHIAYPPPLTHILLRMFIHKWVCQPLSCAVIPLSALSVPWKNISTYSIYIYIYFLLNYSLFIDLASKVSTQTLHVMEGILKYLMVLQFFFEYFCCFVVSDIEVVCWRSFALSQGKTEHLRFIFLHWPEMFTSQVRF